MIINFSDKGNYKSLKKHLKKILHIFENAQKIILVLDNVKYHHAKLLKKFLEQNKRLETLYLPLYSPDLNPIERVWWFMRKLITHNKYLESMKLRKAKFWQMFSHFQIPNETLLTIYVINY
jgi:transposase